MRCTAAPGGEDGLDGKLDDRGFVMLGVEVSEEEEDSLLEEEPLPPKKPPNAMAVDGDVIAEGGGGDG